MEENEMIKRRHKISHLTIIIAYTFFAAVLIIEDCLLGWEKWPLLIIAGGLFLSWIVHVFQFFSEETRAWLYSLSMMFTYFFYGIHPTSFYDIGPVICTVIIIYIILFEKKFINLCMIAFFGTMGYNLLTLNLNGHSWSLVSVSRVVLHIFLVLMAGITAKVIIRNQGEEGVQIDERIRGIRSAYARIEDLLTNISHEFRTPVNAVIGFSALLKRQRSQEEADRHIASIQEAGQRISEKLGDILDYTEIDMGNLVVVNEEYVLSSILQDLITGFGYRKKDSIEMIFDVSADIPTGLVGDGAKIKKVLWHLLDNAVKFTESGCIYVRVYSLPRPYGVNLCMEVRDTGSGMDQESQDHISEKFYQSNSGRTRSSGGLGLGISIINGFVSRMDGFWELRSTEGKGTNVKVSIPQTITDNTPGVSVEGLEGLCLVGWIRYQRFENPEVRDCYEQMLFHLSKQSDVPFYVVENIEQVMEIQKKHPVTHIFVGVKEYEEATEKLENLTGELEVIVIADRGFELPGNSAAEILLKPFSIYSIIGLLRRHTDHESEWQTGEMYCPGIRTLLVDDEPMNLMVAKGILKEYGMEIATAESGKEAIEMYEETAYDLVFMDHMMPEMDGVEAAKELRVIEKKKDRMLLIVALTANAMSGAKEMFKREGFDGFVAKPIEISELERTLRHILPKHAIRFKNSRSDEHDRAESEKDSVTAADSLEQNASAEEAAQIEKADEEREPFAVLEELGVDIQTGLAYCMKDRDFYTELLVKYASEGEEKREKLDNFYEEKNWEDYRILVHAVKSTSKMIGAIEVSELAKALETAAKGKKEVFLSEKHGELMRKYGELTTVLLKSLCPKEETRTDRSLEESESEFLPGGESDES